MIIAIGIHVNAVSEVVQTSDQDASCAPSFRGFLAISYWDENPDTTSELPGLYIPSGLGIAENTSEDVDEEKFVYGVL